VKRGEAPIVGPDVPDQRSLRTPQGVRDLDEFVEFLAHLEAVFGPVERPREVTRGGRFLL
jgi:hypothetical protein